VARLDGVDNFIVTLECDFLVGRGGVAGRNIGDVGGLEHDDMAVLLLVLTATANSAVGDDEQNVEHAKEDTNTATKNKGHGSTLPTTQVGQRVHETAGEAISTMVAVSRDTMEAGRRRMGVRVRTTVGMGMTVLHYCFHVLRMMGVVHRVVGLNQRPSERFSEGVGDLDALLADAAHAAFAWGMNVVASALNRRHHLGDRRLPVGDGVAETGMIERCSSFLDAGRDKNDSDGYSGDLRYSSTQNQSRKSG
jgi:hypothetical protein